jgi:hypothetical protein
MTDDGAPSDAYFPKSLADVSASWLGHALSCKYPGTQVIGLERGVVIGGMATKAQYFLRYNDVGLRHGLPPSLFLKTGFEVHSARAVPLYAAEVNFFRDIAPLKPLRCPEAYYQAIDPETGNGVLLLEDLTLRGVRFGKQAEPLSPDTAAAVLSELAGCHALLWNDRQMSRFPWLKAGGAIREVDVIGEFLDYWDISAGRPRFAKVPQELRDRARIRRALRQMETNDLATANCLVHGDCHLGNLYFEKDHTAGCIDWQTAMRGHWAFDISYFLIVSLSVEDRRRSDRTLLKHYLDQLGVRGVTPPPFEEAWLAYRQHAVWAFLTALCPVEKQPEEFAVLNAERSSAAIVDLASLASLGA